MRPLTYPHENHWWERPHAIFTAAGAVGRGIYGLQDLNVEARVRWHWKHLHRYGIYRPAGMP